MYFFLTSIGGNGSDWEALSVTVENDALAPNNEDRYYSSNIRFQLQSEEFDWFIDSNTPKLFRSLFGSTNIFKGKGYKRSIIYQFGQFIFTPENITTSEPQPDDLPYAGMLYASAGFKVRKENYADTLTLLAAANIHQFSVRKNYQLRFK